LVILLGGEFADRILAQTPAPLRVGVETEGDRTGDCCQVTEGDSIRVFLTANDGQPGDPAVEVWWRLYANPCDGGLFDVIPIQEGSVSGLPANPCCPSTNLETDPGSNGCW
jgi:hypothetical protein